MTPFAITGLTNLRERITIESGRPTLTEAPSLSIIQIWGVVALLLICSSLFAGTALSAFGRTVAPDTTMTGDRQQTLDSYLQGPPRLPRLQ